MDHSALEQIAHWQTAYVQAGKYAGSSVLIHQNGQERFFSAVGQRDLQRATAFDRDTVVRLYSMTKPVTSLAVLILIERGALRLDTPLDAILPEFRDLQALVVDATSAEQTAAAQIPTILQLLTHQSGFSYAFNTGLVPELMAANDISFGPDQGSLEQQVSALARLPLAFQPGEKWEYSVSIDVLGRVIEVVSGQSLDTFLRAEILDPMSMLDTGFCVRPDQIDQFAVLYSQTTGGQFDVNTVTAPSGPLQDVDDAGRSPFLDTTLFSGGGGLVGTIDDYAKFANMLLHNGNVGGHQLVSPKTAQIMRRNHLPSEIADMGPTSFAEQPMRGMGFGLGGSVLLDQKRAQTSGSVGDFSWGGIASTYFWIDPKRQLSIVFFTQLLPSSAYPSRGELKTLVDQAVSP
ncbi:serine hydrolase [Epibacterium sp. SM1979]|uniref:Serine hydrolase n=1 Tax=Tritonibacter litoralis TaxID=2662264 RepID=A0A843YCU0_9RHOB|nr:serine hydrolase domain-containing protein [Tritonibacter litoralis]MQQ07152.1 serine hydrolase [Tritonibacter litoralis]